MERERTPSRTDGSRDRQPPYGVGAADHIRTPDDADLVDGAGGFLIPGLWDMHVHSVANVTWDMGVRSIGNAEAVDEIVAALSIEEARWRCRDVPSRMST